jgi:hypothetical protein
MAISFPLLARPLEHVSAKLLQLHHDYAEKTVHWIAHEYFLGQHDYKLKIKKTSVFSKWRPKLKSWGGDNVLPDQCCHTPEGPVIYDHWEMLDSWTDRENWQDLKKKICFIACSFTMNPIQSDARFNCSCTIRGQHLTTQHHDSIIFIWNVHSKTVWTLHWYCIVHWYQNQYKILESKEINLQWVSRPPASFVNIWQVFKKNMRSNLHYNYKNMSLGLP